MYSFMLCHWIEYVDAKANALWMVRAYRARTRTSLDQISKCRFEIPLWVRFICAWIMNEPWKANDSNESNEWDINGNRKGQFYLIKVVFRRAHYTRRVLTDFSVEIVAPLVAEARVRAGEKIKSERFSRWACKMANSWKSSAKIVGFFLLLSMTYVAERPGQSNSFSMVFSSRIRCWAGTRGGWTVGLMA